MHALQYLTYPNFVEISKRETQPVCLYVQRAVVALKVALGIVRKSALRSKALSLQSENMPRTMPRTSTPSILPRALHGKKLTRKLDLRSCRRKHLLACICQAGVDPLSLFSPSKVRYRLAYPFVFGAARL